MLMGAQVTNDQDSEHLSQSRFCRLGLDSLRFPSRLGGHESDDTFSPILILFNFFHSLSDTPNLHTTHT